MTRRQSVQLVERLSALLVITIALCYILFWMNQDYYAGVTMIGGILFAIIHTCLTLRR